METALNLLLKLLFRIRWAYFHIHPGYTKLYIDKARTSAHFFHARTNSLHSDYRIGPNVRAKQEPTA